jgi:hypothetical protein
MSLIESAARSAYSGAIDLGVMPSELDGGVASRAAIGLVVLATDQTMEHEFRVLVRQPGVAFYESRIFNDHDITPETLRAIGPRIAPSVDLIATWRAWFRPERALIDARRDRRQIGDAIRLTAGRLHMARHARHYRHSSRESCHLANVGSMKACFGHFHRAGIVPTEAFGYQ